MKKLLIPILAFVLVEASSQVPIVELKDSTFTKAMDTFIDSLSSLEIKNQTIVLVTIRKLELRQVDIPVNSKGENAFEVQNVLNYELTLTLERDLGFFNDECLPSLSFDYRNRKFFVRFNIEDLFRFKDDDMKAIVKQASRYFKNFNGSSALAGMVITVRDKNISIGYFAHISRKKAPLK